MFKVLKWFFGFDEKIEYRPVKLIYCLGWNESVSAHEDILKLCNDITRRLGYNVAPEDLWVLQYSDLQDKFLYTQSTPKLDNQILEYVLETDSHAVIFHEGTCQNTWSYATELGNLLTNMKGFRTYTSLGFASAHGAGTAHIRGRSKPYLVNHDIDHVVCSENFEIFGDDLLRGFSK